MGNITSLDERRRRKENDRQEYKGVRERRVVYKKTIDYSLLVPVVLLIALGLVMVFSSSYYASEYRNSSSASAGPQYFFIKQLAFVIVGFVLMALISFFDYHKFLSFIKGDRKKQPFYKKTYIWLLALGFLLSIMVFIPGIGSSTNDSSRWIRIGGITLMPAEPMKAALIIYLGCDMAENSRMVMRWNKGMWRYVAVWIAICAITYLQRNFSAIICYTALFIIMVYVAGFDSKQLMIFMGTLVALLAVFVFMEGYRASRITSWYNMLKESLGLPYEEVDRDAKWQVQQSLYAIGTGGLFGKGIGNSIQKYLWLSLGETDFIFAIIAEELGLVGCLGVILLYGYIIYRGMLIAKNAPDLTGKLIAAGITSIFAIQVVLNMCVNTTLIPNTGVVLPFVSYGGSSVVIFMCMMGVLLNISKQCTPIMPMRLIRNTSPLENTNKTKEINEKREPAPTKAREWKI